MKKFIIFLALIMSVVFVGSSFAALTLTNRTESPFGNKRKVIGQLAFDSSYPAGGEALALTTIGITAPESVHIFDKNGYSFEYDYTNKKVKVFQPAPPIVYDEQHTAVGNGLTLDYPASWIINVADSGGNQKLVVTGLASGSLGDDECSIAVAIADGTRTSITTKDTTGTYYVTYATQAWQELYSLLVQDEAITLATGTGNSLAYSLMSLGYISTNSNSDNLSPVDAAQDINALNIGVNFSTSAADVFTADEAQNTSPCKVTYLKLPATGSWLRDRFIDDEDATVASGSGSYSTYALDFPMLLWCNTGSVMYYSNTTEGICAEYTVAAATDAQINWGYRGPAATGSAPAAGSVITSLQNATISVDLTSAAYLKGHPWEIPGLVPLETKNGANLSDLSGVRIEVIGR